MEQLYDEFIRNKGFVMEANGVTVDKSELNSNLFKFQKDIVCWALAKGELQFLRIVV